MEELTGANTKKPVYRDELNFAEFPLASLSDRLPEDQKTLVFKDKIVDQSTNTPVIRTLTISASDEYGLPTAQDDEVILGLIQLSKRDDFKDRKIYFTRYELIKLLGWRDESKSYARISESLKRWLGVTLYYDKAWWSKEEKCWVSENFHILDQVTIFDKERRERRLKTKRGDPAAGKSSFVWNDVVYDSFQAGYLKKIDMELFKTLKSSISKRIYRFLDKRFYKKEHLEFDMHTFALEHVGLSRNYHTGEIKRRLRGAILELERVGFLEPLTEEARFKKLRAGRWKITLIKSKAEAAAVQIEDSKVDQKLLAALVKRGISTKAARELIQENSESLIREKIELFDHLRQNHDQRLSENPAGFLYKAIVDDYAMPADFKTERELKKERAKNLRLARKRLEEETQRKLEVEAKEDSERELLNTFWKSLSNTEKQEFEEEAVKMADKFLLTQYKKGKREGGVLFRTVRQTILDRHIKRKLNIAEAA